MWDYEKNSFLENRTLMNVKTGHKYDIFALTSYQKMYLPLLLLNQACLPNRSENKVLSSGGRREHSTTISCFRTQACMHPHPN